MFGQLKLQSKCIFALLTVVMLLSTPVASLAVASTSAPATIEITASRIPLGASRAYADKTNWSMYLHDPAHTGFTSSPLPVNNATIWTVDLGALALTAPVVVNNTVILATSAGVAHAINASTGIELWSTNLGLSNPSTAAVWNGHVMFGNQNGDLISLYFGNGTVEWKDVLAAGAADTTPIVANGVVYIGTGSGKVWAYNITDNKQLWTKTTVGAVKYSPALSGATLLVASANTLESFNASNGNPGWTCATAGTEISGASITGGPAKTSTWTAFVLSNDGFVYALNMTNGHTRWKGIITYGRILTPTIKAPLVLASGLGLVQALNISNGKNVWNITATDIPVTPPEIGNTTLIFGTKTSLNVTAFTATTHGPQKWAYALKNPNAPAIAYGRAFVTTGDGKVLAFGHRSVAAIDSILPDPVAQNGALTLKGHGTGAAAYKTFRWSSNIDGIFAEGSNPILTLTPTLSIGTHNISLQVQDDNWTWSLPVNGQLIVSPPKDWPMFRANTERTGATGAKVPSTNSTKWTANLAPTTGAVMASPIIVDKFAFIGTLDFYMHSMNSSTGQELWSYKTEGQIESTAAYSNGYIYFGSDDFKVYCMESNPTDGIDDGIKDPSGAPYDLIWTFTTNGPVWSSPTVINNVVYVVSEGPADQQHPNPGRLYALRTDPYTANREIWHFTIPNNVVSYSSPLVYGDLVLFGTNDNRLYAVNRLSGKEAWNVTTLSNVQSSPTAANGMIYFTSNDGKVYAVWASNGTVAWSRSTGGSGLGGWSSPAVSNGVVYVGSMDTKLYALNATTGVVRWTYSAMDGIESSPSVAADQVVFGDLSGILYVVNTTTHALKWSKNVGYIYQSSPAITDDTILIGSGNGTVHAIGRAPDLSVVTKDISYSLSRPTVGVPLDISVTVRNKGTMTGNGTVTIYDQKENKYIDIASGFVQLAPGASAKVSGTITPTVSGIHTLSVNVTNIKPYDSDPLNNKALGSIKVLGLTGGWRMFQKDPQHSGSVNVLPPNNNKVLWTSNLHSAISASPVGADQMVYIGAASGVYAFFENGTGQTGLVQWSNLTIRNVTATPAVVNGIIYVASMDGSLYAMDAWDGSVLWSLDISVGSSSPVVYNGTVIVGTQDGYVMAIGAMNHTVLWRKAIGGKVVGSPAVFDNKAVIVGNADGTSSRVASFDLRTGAELWSYKTGFNMLSSPSIDPAGYAYLADSNGTIYKFDMAPPTASAKLMWRYPTGMAVQSTITVSGSNIYLTAGNSTIMSLTTNGELNWKRAYTHLGNSVLSSSPAISLNDIFVGGSMIYCLERTTGQMVWSFTTKSNVDASPAIIDSGTVNIAAKVVFATDDGGIYVFNSSTPVKPTAIISSPKNNETYRLGENITFDGSASIDDGVILEYRWDFGDYNRVLGMVVTHAYDHTGNYTIKLIVTDNEGLNDTTNVTIHVVIDHAPTLDQVAVSPHEGNTTTLFSFNVIYVDLENDSPAYVKVVLGGLEYSMAKADKNATDFRAGVRYYCSTKLPSGNAADNTFIMKASDGILSFTSKPQLGPKVWQKAKFTKAEVSVEMEFVGSKGVVSMEYPSFTPQAPTGLSKVDLIFISTTGITEWRWMNLTIDGTGTNITTGYISSSLNIYWLNKTWQNLSTIQDLKKPSFSVYVTSDMTPLLGTFGLFGKLIPPYLAPKFADVKSNPTDAVINVKNKVTLDISATTDVSPGNLWFKIIWGEKGAKNNETDWLPGTKSSGPAPWKNTAPPQSYTYNKKGTYKVEIYVSDDHLLLTNLKTPLNQLNQSKVTKYNGLLEVTVREEGSSEALVLLVVIILVVLAVAFAVPIKGDKDEDEDEEEEEEEPVVDKEIKKDTGKDKGKGKKPVVAAAEEE